MFVCKVCGKEVKAGQAFCPTCGADVVENYETVCPVCNAKNSAGSKYCAKCGGILHVMRKPVCSVCGAKNLPGAKFCVSCGAPIKPESDTHSDADMIDARKAKRRLDNMERERMAAVDKEIAQMRAKTAEEREIAMQEVDEYRNESEKEYAKKARTLELYREKLNELGSEDVELLKKMSVALKDYSKYYADPYSQIDEDDIDEDVYVCPACGTINPNTATKCSHCGRNKARALLLLAKGKIKQSPPIKRKKDVIAAPEADLERKHVPTLDEFIADLDKQPTQEEQPLEKKEQQADFSGPYHMPYGAYPYPYPPYAYGCPYAQQKPCEQCNTQPQNSSPCAQPGFYANKPDAPYQMPPIVQPVAFVPYVTQEQPLMQYTPLVAEEKRPQRPATPTAIKPVKKK